MDKSVESQRRWATAGICALLFGLPFLVGFAHAFMPCGSMGRVGHGNLPATRSTLSCSITATLPAGSPCESPLCMPACTEAESCVDEVDPRHSTSYSWPLRNACRRTDDLDQGHRNGRFVAASSFRGANAADLSRLCRLLL